MEAWETFLNSLEQKMGKTIVDRWIRPLKVADFDACNLYLEAENEFQVNWFKEQLPRAVLESFKNNNGHPIKIHFINRSPSKKGGKKVVLELPPLELRSDQIDPSSTFTNYITGKENELVLQFFKQIIPGGINPVFLFGPEGTGKTHLLMACAHHFRSLKLSVFYVHAETFTEHVVKAIRSSQMADFRRIYRNQDVLIIDDIHHLARKAATQEELFHTFNTLHTSGRQIILSSHLPPNQIQEIEPRLISRFEWGIVLQLQELPPSERKALLINKAKTHNFPLSDQLATFLVESFVNSVTTMIRGLEALMLRYRGQGFLSIEEAKILLSDLIIEEEKIQLTPEKILQTTSAYFGIRNEDILGKSQAKEFVLPRKLAMFFCRKKLKMPYLAIGRFFGRDHSTVMTSIKQIENNSSDSDLALSEIEKLF